MDTLAGILIWAPPILFALTVHEFAHGWVANKLGDPTAKYAGRLTLNPLSHLDPIGTLMLFIVHFGWAKPVPVNPFNFRNPRKDMMWVSLAGPGSNILCALGCGIIIRFLSPFVAGMDPKMSFFSILFYMLVFGLVINIALAIFNLLPIPPLDGSKILMGILPPEYEPQIVQLERFGPFLLIFLVMMSWMVRVNFFWIFIGPFISFFSILFAGMDLARFF